MYRLTPEELNTELKRRYRTFFESLGEAIEHVKASQEYHILSTLKSLGIKSVIEEDDVRINSAIGRKSVITPDPLDLLDIDQLVRDFVREVLNAGQMEVVFSVDVQPTWSNDGKVTAFEYEILWNKQNG